MTSEVRNHLLIYNTKQHFQQLYIYIHNIKVLHQLSTEISINSILIRLENKQDVS